MAALTVWLSRPTPRSLLLGAGLVAAGTALRVWAAGHVEKSREVTSSGPYRFTRHPLYLGSTLLGLGIAVSANHLWLGLAVVAYLVLTLGGGDPLRGGAPAREVRRGLRRLRRAAGAAERPPVQLGAGASGTGSTMRSPARWPELGAAGAEGLVYSEFRRSVSRAVSSVGRAPALHAGCHRFEPCTAHHSLADGRGTTCTRRAVARRLGS